MKRSLAESGESEHHAVMRTSILPGLLDAVANARRHGVLVKPIAVNESEWWSFVDTEGALRLGFHLVRVRDRSGDALDAGGGERAARFRNRAQRPE